MKTRTKRIISYSLTAMVVAVAALWVCSKFLRLGDVEFTDNAQVCRQIVPVISRVQGYIKEIRFDEYMPVHKGDTLIIIDDADYRLRLARARADLANAEAGKSVASGSVTSASANVDVTRASIDEAKALMDLAAKDLARYENLLRRDAVTRQQYDAARTDYEAKRARYAMMSRQRAATGTVVDVSRRRISQSEAAIDLARAQVESAELDLSYCVITAPCDGYTSRKGIQTGQLVNPGQTLLDVVDSGELWITANYKETQLRHIQPGSAVEITVDAVPGTKFKGKVISLSAATGAALSVLPQDNSAGNFVKVRQRIPVRIELDPGDNPADAVGKLRAGMNVECSVKY